MSLLVGEWLLTVHADKRRRRRHLSTAELHLVITEPELTYPDGKHEGAECRVRGRWVAVVDPKAKTVLTVLHNRKFR
jgi:hypothetical protein